jgi:aryl-alcohol dehydrogenase-like predicted oxidoreductase
MPPLEDVPGLCLGGNVFGWTADEAESFAILDAALDAGVNFVDTADVYSAWAPGHEGGESEAIIGRWMADRGVRDRVVVATKVGMWARHKGIRPAAIRAGSEDSLRRLQSDVIDLYYAHEDDGGDLAETMAAFDALVQEGKVRWIGLSNFTAERLREAVAICARDGLTAPVALQPQYSLMERAYERNGLRDACEELGLACFPYSALASGFLTGKYRPGGPEVDSPRAGRAAEYAQSSRGQRVLAALDEVAAAHGAPVTAVALAWLRAQPTVAAPAASARSVRQLDALLASLDLELTADELATLTEASQD